MPKLWLTATVGCRCCLQLFSSKNRSSHGLRTLLGWWSRFQLIGISGFWEEGKRGLAVLTYYVFHFEMKIKSCLQIGCGRGRDHHAKKRGNLCTAGSCFRTVVRVFAQIIICAGWKLSSLDKWTCPYLTTKVKHFRIFSTWAHGQWYSSLGRHLQSKWQDFTVVSAISVYAINWNSTDSCAQRVPCHP